jgi:hypothetical protein
MSGDVEGVDEPPGDSPISESADDLREEVEEFAEVDTEGRSGAV